MVIFTNDNNIEIQLFGHKFDELITNRDNHEILFRKINTYLINNNYIKGNIIDSGAWIGDNTIPWAKNIKKTVFAIDPSSENCNYIKELALYNNILNIKLIETALSDKIDILYTNDTDNHYCFLHNSSNNIKNISATTIDHLLNNGIIYEIDYIHLDVELMELKVIKGSIELIKKFKPIITFEQHIETENYMEICTLLATYEYNIYIIDEILPGCNIDCRNFIAFPSNIDTNTIIVDLEKNIKTNILIKIIT